VTVNNLAIRSRRKIARPRRLRIAPRVPQRDPTTSTSVVQTGSHWDIPDRPAAMIFPGIDQSSAQPVGTAITLVFRVASRKNCAQAESYIRIENRRRSPAVWAAAWGERAFDRPRVSLFGVVENDGFTGAAVHPIASTMSAPEMCRWIVAS